MIFRLRLLYLKTNQIIIVRTENCCLGLRRMLAAEESERGFKNWFMNTLQLFFGVEDVVFCHPPVSCYENTIVFGDVNGTD